MPSFKRKRIPENPNTSISKRMRSMRKSTVGSLTRKVNKILSEQERKNFDVAAGPVALAAGAAVLVQLNSILQGDDAVSRDGRKVAMVSSQMRYYLTGNGGGLGMFRVIVLIDKQSNGIACVAADILTAPGNVLSPLTLDFKERFRVIHDNYSSLGKGDFDVDAALANTATIPGSYFHKISDDLAQVEFGGIGTVPTSGALIVLFLAEKGTNLNYYHRLRFTDS